jgi:hypothetical protein
MRMKSVVIAVEARGLGERIVEQELHAGFEQADIK